MFALQTSNQCCLFSIKFLSLLKLFIMNAKAITILVVFLGWSIISWKWYLCRIKEKCDDEPKTALIQASDTVSNEVTIKVDSTLNHEEKSVQELDHRTILYFQNKATHFDEDSSINSYLSKLASKLLTSKDTVITIVGHTDDKGLDSTNLILSYQRARDVQTYMVAKGVPITKIKIEGKGEKEPIVPDTTLEGRNKNRRVEILFNK